MRRSALIVLLLASVLSLLYAWRYHFHNPDRVAAKRQHSVGPSVPRGRSPDPFLPDAPEFELTTLDSHSIRLSDYRGRAVLLNFWATWCVPCKTEVPWLIDFQQKYGPQGLVVIGIALDDTPNEVAKFAQRMRLNYPVALATEAVRRAYGGPMGVPTTFFIDRSGKVTDQNTGARPRDHIENEIRLALMNSGAAAGPPKRTAIRANQRP